MAAAVSILKALRLMDDRSNDQTTATQSDQQSSNTSVELGINFKMVKDCNNNSNKARPSTPTPSTDDECSSVSADGDQNSKDSNPDDDVIRQKLSMRAYHLPGNNWRQDLGMYIKNNHLIFGICCHHRLHPVTVKHRLVILLGSLAFGLSATNAIYLYYLWGKDDVDRYDDTALSISLGGDVVENVVTNSVTIDISHGMALLWTVGAAAHSFFDLALWHMIACGCMKRKFCRVVGSNMAVAIVMLIIALTTFVVVVRAYESGDKEIYNSDQDDGGATFASDQGFGHHADFQYLYGYGVELLLSLFVYTPLAQVLLFTGLFGCGAVPFLGGRPYEARKWKRRSKTGSDTNGMVQDV